MKYIIPLLLVFTLIFAACSTDDSRAYVSFSTNTSRGISADVTYPSMLGQTWTLVASKTDGGDTTGGGTYEDILLTDTFGPFASGSWSFTLSSDLFEGTATPTLHAGPNTVHISVHTLGDKGTLSLEDCNFSLSDKGAVSSVILKVDDSDLKTWTLLELSSDDNDLYFIPTFTKKLTKGIHHLVLRYVFQSGDYEDDDDIVFRIDAQATTHMTIGETESSFLLNVTLDEAEAIVE